MVHPLRFALFVVTLCLSTFILGPRPVQALSWQVNGSGILTGATGVNVGGTLFDVQFLDGTCAALFSGCDQPTDFTFPSFTDAIAASRALLDQVFVNTGVNGNPFGNFDSDPALTQGCTSLSVCITNTPFLVFTPGDASNFSTFNSIGISDSVIGPVVFNVDTTTRDDVTWARWEPAANPVPEPASLLLLGSGLAGLAAWRRRRH